MKLPALTPGAVIKAMLGLQLGMAVVMFSSDIMDGWRGFALAPTAPALDQPVAPGDQRRRYRPGALPPGPANRPFPAPVDMPARLRFEQLEQDGTPILRLTGEIAPGDGQRFADWIETATTQPATVMLNSPGGSVTDALDIGRQVRALGLDSELAAGDLCLSACPYVLIGGVHRRVDAAAAVGLHQHYFGESTVLPAFMAVENIQRGQGEVMEYLDEMGVDPMMMRHALITPPDEIYILLPEELERYQIVTDEPA